MFGQPAKMDTLKEISQENKISLIEDAAQAHGAEFNEKKAGSIGDIGCFSFYATKNMTTGEGGMLLNDNDKLATRCRSLRNLCFQAKKRFVHEKLGWNFRMTNLQAALGIAQLENLDAALIKKRRMGQRYTELLADIEALQLPLTQTDYAGNVYWVYGLVLEPQ